ncbi:Gfo/Idh/MocA family oxidoreductase [Clostridium sp. LIBA-8841]|uniref:Gfo/Idh/MocA family protein n=1 Tax=Clostridium sp. LIBA-8841 TaxID=2987530 RepID=UPI002AC46D9E|nr:Gfo/Idh/MocA family oxidoreductase [Clostridium sp. LIBA-8841]MDZ5253753.1 Gfo/Idh/MocA family oxidoreductase [Clostridium sp. LIBA-8841]
MIRLGIAGIGCIAEEYIKLIVSNKIKGCHICALSSRNFERMESICSQYDLKDVSLFTSYEDMLESGKIDMVMICTPHFNHPSMAIKAIESGIHPLIEKPVGVFSDEVEELMKCIERHPNILSGVLYCRRTSQAFNKVKDIISSGKIGELKRANWIITNLYRTQAYHNAQSWKGTYKGEGGGLLMTQASHQLDLLIWLCGMPKNINAFCYCGAEREIEVENDVMLHMQYENGATAQFIASSREFPGSNRLEIIGSKGQIILCDDQNLIFRELEQDEKLYANTTNELYGKIPFKEQEFTFNDADNSIQQAAIVNNFISSIEGNTMVLCPVKEAINSLYIINGAYLSSWNNEVVTFPMDTKEFRVKLEERF